MITIAQGQASRRIFNNQKDIIGYCVENNDEWTAIIFSEGPTKFGVNSRSPLIQRNNDIVLVERKLKDLRVKIENVLFQYGWN